MKSEDPKKPAPFEPEFINGLVRMFEHDIPFNHLLGITLEKVEPGGVCCGIEMRPELVGHYLHQRLHGGVISAMLDATAGLAVMAAIGGKHMDESPDKRLARFARLGTIDLRIDYLRQGIGQRFESRAQVLRLGSRVANTRMEFLDAEGALVATGAAAYIVS